MVPFPASLAHESQVFQLYTTTHRVRAWSLNSVSHGSNSTAKNEEDPSFPTSATGMGTELVLEHVIGSDPHLEGMVAYHRGTYMKQFAVKAFINYMDT